MSEGPKVKGHLIITVAEASGKNKDDQLVWDPNFVEGFVKGESTIAPSMGTAGSTYGHVLIYVLIVQWRFGERRGRK